MRFGDLLDPHRGPETLVRFALYLLIFFIVFHFILCLLTHLPPAAEFGMLCVVLLLSPLAFLIRERRKGRPRRDGARRGSERTPLLPPNEVEQ